LEAEKQQQQQQRGRPIAQTGLVALRLRAPPGRDVGRLRRRGRSSPGSKGARDKTSGERVTNFTRNNTVYSYNDGAGTNPREHDLDRDNDRIACEKR
jgi:hypothetical protein